MADKYVTVMIVPERSDKVRRFTLPAIYLKIASVVIVLLAFSGVFIFFDYLHVLSQVAENKRLRNENHVLKVDVQAAKNRLESLDQSVTRLKSFAHKLRVIGNLDNPQAAKMLRTPTQGQGSDAPIRPGGSVLDLEDSGEIEDPERPGASTDPDDTIRQVESPDPENPHDQLAYQRSLTLLGGELAASIEAQDLVDQVSAISQGAAKLREIAELEEQSFAELQELFQDRVDRLLRTPSIVPSTGWFSSEFGYRYNPYSGRKTFHAGIDIANNTGTPIYAPADGVVTYAGRMGGFGIVVRIEHGYGIVTKFGHNSSVTVKNGQSVKRGELIAKMGSSGRSTGPHLHYQVELNGKPVNPRYFMLEDTF